MTVWLRSIRTVTATDADALRASFPRRVQRAEGYKREDDRLRSLAAALLLRDALGLADETALRYGPRGKPYLDGGPAFSLSHSGDWAALALGEADMRAVGVDIERLRPIPVSLPRRVCAPEELDWLEAAPDSFLCLWTLKEAVIKALGTGLGTDLRTIKVLPMTEGKPIDLDGRRWYGAAAEHAGYALALCADAPVKRCEVKIIP